MATKKQAKKAAPKKAPAKMAKAGKKPATFAVFNEQAQEFELAEAAKPVAMRGFEGFVFFLYKGPEGSWVVSEAASGAAIAGGKTQGEAKKAAQAKLKEVGSPTLAALIRKAVQKHGLPTGHTLPKACEDAAAAAVPEAKARKPRARKDGKLSQMDAAVQVLTDAGEALTCKEIVRRMLEKQLWETEGRTPGATLSAALQRDIAKRGEGSRFKKAARGLFGLNAAAQA